MYVFSFLPYRTLLKRRDKKSCTIWTIADSTQNNRSCQNGTLLLSMGTNSPRMKPISLNITKNHCCHLIRNPFRRSHSWGQALLPINSHTLLAASYEENVIYIYIEKDIVIVICIINAHIVNKLNSKLNMT